MLVSTYAPGGHGGNGQLGNGTGEHQRVPGPVSGLAELMEGARVVMVAAGSYHSAASTSEGEVMTWGYGAYALPPSPPPPPWWERLRV